MHTATLNSALVSVTHRLEYDEMVDAASLKSLAMGMMEPTHGDDTTGGSAGQGTAVDWNTAERLLRRALAIQEETLGECNKGVPFLRLRTCSCALMKPASVIVERTTPSGSVPLYML